MALYDPSIIKTGIERHQNAENNSKKLPVPLEVNFGGRNLKITDYNELFDLNKINGNSRRITTLTIKTVSTYKQKLDRSLSSEQLVNNKQLNQLNSNKLTNLESNHPNANHSREEESNKDLQFGCESASVKLKNSLSSNNDKENFLNQATRSDFVNTRNDDLEKRRIKEYKIEKSIEIEPKIKVNDDQQLNNFKKYNDNQPDDNFFRNTKKSSSLRQINVKSTDTDLSRSKNSYLVSDNFDNLNKLSNFNSHQSLPPRSQQSNKQTAMSNRTKEQFTELKSDQKGKFYFNGTNQNKVNLNDDVDNLSSNLNGQKLSAINDKQERNRFKEHLNASLNSSFNSNHNFGLNKQKDGNNNRNYTGSNSMKPHQPQINTNHFNSQTNPPQSHFQLQNLQQQKQLNQLNQFNNESYLEQYHQNQANTNSSIRKQYRKLSAGGSNLDEINCDEFVSELKTKIASNNQTTSSPATIAKLNNFQQSNSLGAKNERSNRHLILDTSTMPHLNKRTNQQNSVNNTTVLNSPSSNTLPSSTKKSSSSYLTSTVRRNESFQKATEHYRIRMEPRMRSIRSNKDLQPELPNNKQPAIHNNPNVSEPDSQQQLNAANFNQKRFSYLGSQAANGYQPENENVANETCTTDDWNTTLDTNAETRSSDDRSSRQIKKCDKYGFFIEDDQQPQKQQLKSGRTGSIRKEDEQAKKTNSETDKRREMKWLEMLQNWDKYMQKKWNKICERCRKGIPSSLRGTAWFHLCAAHKQKRNKPDLYQLLCKQPGNASINDEIIKDLHRQFPNHIQFSGINTKGQQDLFTVLKNFSIIKPDIGYCQGEAPIVSVLLMHIPDPEDAFFVLMQLCDHYLSGYFSPGLETLQMHGQMLNAMLKRYNNTVYKILKKQKIDPIQFNVEWFMCLFCRTLPWGTVLRVWDMFFCEGIKIVFRVALVILNSLEPEFKKAKCNQNDKLIETMEVLKNIPKKYLEIDYLIPKVIEMNLSEKDLEQEHFNILKKMKRDKKKSK